VRDSAGVPTTAATTSTVTFTVRSQFIFTPGSYNSSNMTLEASVPFTYSVFGSVIGGVPPYVYSVVGSLPAGLGASLNTTTGVLSGTPTASNQSGSVPFRVQDSLGTYASLSTDAYTNYTSFLYNIVQNITAVNNPTAQSWVTNTSVSFYPFTGVVGGITPYYYYVSSGTLPTGVAINSSTGQVSGTPTAVYSGTVVFSVRDVNNITAATTSTVSITVTGSITASATTTAQSYVVSRAITAFRPLTASGGTAPYNYTVTPALPAGLSLNSTTGQVSGTPTVATSAANYVFSVQDANNVAALTTSTVNITVAAALSVTTVAAQSLNINTAITAFNPITPVGGVGPYTYSYSGTLPAGLTYVNGVLSGTPTAAYSGNVTFTSTDSLGSTASGTVGFTVVKGPVTINYLVVAGGGAGAATGQPAGGGGGGGGGVVTGTYTKSPGTVLQITVGTGGAYPGSTVPGIGNNGTPSTLTGATTAIGGGGGGFQSNGNPGGSGGGYGNPATVGAGGGSTVGGSGTAGQGNPGTRALAARVGGGGGGAGGSSIGCQYGGIGAPFYGNFYGGGGSGYNLGPGLVPGAPGGGGGRCSYNGQPGTGGGGAAGGSGGPGVVVLAIPYQAYPGSAPGASVVYYNGGYTLLITFTSPGSYTV
jgi:hypothetical protein